MQNVLNLNEYGVTQLQYAEMEQTEGGNPVGWGLFIAGAIFGGAIYDGVKWLVTENNDVYGRRMMASGGSGGAK